MTSVWQGPGPRPRDELTAWSDLGLPNTDQLTEVPAWVPPPAGRSVTVDGLDVFVRSTPGSAIGEHMWFIHGLGGSSEDASRLSYALSDSVACFAPDLPGSGYSSPAPADNYDIEWQADLCAQLIRRCSARPVHLVGNSRGGFVAAALAARHPELISTLTLISPAVPDFRMKRDRGADVRLGLVMTPGLLETAVALVSKATPAMRAQGLVDMCFGEPQRVPPSAVTALSESIAAQQQYPWMSRALVLSLRSLLSAQLGIGTMRWKRLAASVTAPTLVIWGTRDRLVDVRLARKTADTFTDSRLLVLARTGHVAQIEAPAVTAWAIQQLWSDTPSSGAAPDMARSSVAA